MTRIGQSPDGAGRYAIRWRKDGKPARAANLLGGVPTVHNGEQQPFDGFRYAPAPSWNELVQPGPKGDPAQALKRAVRAAEHRAEPCTIHREHQANLPHKRYHGDRIETVLHRRKPARPSGFALASPNCWEGHAQRIALGMIR